MRVKSYDRDAVSMNLQVKLLLLIKAENFQNCFTLAPILMISKQSFDIDTQDERLTHLPN